METHRIQNIMTRILTAIGITLSIFSISYASAAENWQVVAKGGDYLWYADSSELRTSYGRDRVKWLVRAPDRDNVTTADLKYVLARANCSDHTIGLSDLRDDRNEAQIHRIIDSATPGKFKPNTVGETIYNSLCK